ncbi:MAG: 30S ribosomal protein S6 [Candidatus Beckwithbacteria bacterium]|nr:30S ribosomal protein S6 [Candidatus Beckwithbacteria bacterium]
MRKYTLALVLTEERDLTQLLFKVKGKITNTKILGSRPLAYRIKKASEGWYGFFEVELPETQVKELNKLLKEDEKVLRFLLVKKEGASYVQPLIE